MHGAQRDAVTGFGVYRLKHMGRALRASMAHAGRGEGSNPKWSTHVTNNNETKDTKMATMSEGIFPCTVLHGKAGENDKGVMQVQISVRFDEGPDKGRCATYEDEVNVKSALYIRRSCTAVGWTGKTLNTLAGDIETWVKATGGKSTAEVKHVALKDSNKKYKKWIADGAKGDPPVWDKVNSLGRGPKPLKQASESAMSDADYAMQMAAEADGEQASDTTMPARDSEMPF